jgi:hypothetical protein
VPEADADLLRELIATVRRAGITASEEDLAIVLSIFRENREGLERLRRRLAETEEPAVVFSSLNRRNDR